MYPHYPVYSFDQQFFGVMPVYAFVMGPAYHVGANRNLMGTFMPQLFWRAGPNYLNRLQHRQRPALMPKEYNKQTQKKREQQRKQEIKKPEEEEQQRMQENKKCEEISQKQLEQEIMKQKELEQEITKQKEREQEIMKQKQLEEIEEVVKNQERQEQEQEFKEAERKPEVEVDETSAWQIPRLDGKEPQKKLLQTLILEEEVIDSLQNRHLEEELRARHVLQKIHLEEELRAKKQLKMRHLEEQLRVMHSLQKQQLEEELREKRLLQERQLKDELKAKESLQRRHLEEELRVKELLLNRKRVSRKQQPEEPKETSKLRQQNVLQEKPKKNQLRQDQKIRKQPDHVDLNRKELKQLLTQEICQLKKEILSEKAGKANNVQGQKCETDSVVLDRNTKLSSLSEAEFAKHSCGHHVESDTLEKTDRGKSLVKDNLSVSVISHCKSLAMDSESSSSFVMSNGQNPCDELDHISPIGNTDSSICNSSPMESDSNMSSFTVISESNDDNIEFDDCDPIQMKSESNSSYCSVISEVNYRGIDGLLTDCKDQSEVISRILPIQKSTRKSPGTESKLRSSSVRSNNKAQSDTQCDDFGGLSPIENCKSPNMESKSSSFSVMTIGKAHDDKSRTISVTDSSESTKSKSPTMVFKSCQKSCSAIPDKNDYNIDDLPMSVKDQNHMQYDESFRKDCIRCGRPFYVNDLGEYLKSETCTYHWSTLHYVYEGKQGYTAQYTCCKGHKYSEGCIRSALHIWNGVIYNS